jgi:undecaprenyl-diphosphatase
LAAIVFFVCLTRFAIRYFLSVRVRISGEVALRISKSASKAEAKTRQSDAYRRQVIRRLLLSVVVTGCTFAGLAFLVVDWSVISSLDIAINGSFEPYRAPWLVLFFSQITSLGTVISMGMIAAVISALLWSMKRGQILIPFWISFVGAEATTWITKYGINRARPAFLDGVTEINPSFPSGHATASTVVLGFIGYIIACELANRSQKVEVAFWTTVCIGLVCFSRMFLSLHYLSDVLSGVLVASLWLLVGLAINERQKIGQRHPHAYQFHRDK